MPRRPPRSTLPDTSFPYTTRCRYPKNSPPGWTYWPSTDAQRLPIVAMGLVGRLTSRILTAYQLGHIDTAWEPFFVGSLSDPRNGTEEIITSEIGRAHV